MSGGLPGEPVHVKWGVAQRHDRRWVPVANHDGELFFGPESYAGDQESAARTSGLMLAERLVDTSNRRCRALMAVFDCSALRSHRLLSERSLKDGAAAVGRCPSSLSMYERGLVVPPSDVLAAIADWLGCEVSDFFTEPSDGRTPRQAAA